MTDDACDAFATTHTRARPMDSASDVSYVSSTPNDLHELKETLMRYRSPKYTTASPQPVLLDVPCPNPDCKAPSSTNCSGTTRKVQARGHLARQMRAANERARWQTVQTEARWQAEDRDAAQQLALRDEDEARRRYPDHLDAINEILGAPANP